MPAALITGASTGIGRATALRLAAAGWTVFAGVRDPAAGERLIAEAPAGGRMIPVTLDVRSAEQIGRAAEIVEQETGQAGQPGTGRLDALVNNAGIGAGGPLELIPIDELRTVFEVNTIGQVAVTQAMLPALRRARGRIVFVTSIGGRVAMAFSGAYAASKHALEAVGDALRVELRTSNVQVALVEPASVATPIWGKATTEIEHANVPAELQREYGNVPEALDELVKNVASRGVPPEQVAGVIEGALTARRMRARYLIGGEARAMLALKRLLPDRAFDRLARRLLGV
jgi:NAD(P)-dependent dehydrogenase (short-subunit alcohol dehydrogenase family)